MTERVDIMSSCLPHNAVSHRLKTSALLTKLNLCSVPCLPHNDVSHSTQFDACAKTNGILNENTPFPAPVIIRFVPRKARNVL